VKTIIAGNRLAITRPLIEEALNRIDWTVYEIVCSDVNHSVIEWASENNITLKIFETESDFYKDAAKAVRNARMAKYSDALIAIWDGKPGDTARLIAEAKELGLRVVVFLESELKDRKKSNPIKNNPVFGEQVEKAVQTGKKDSLATRVIEFNGKRLVVYEDDSKNQPLVNMVVELVDEVKRLRG